MKYVLVLLFRSPLTAVGEQTLQCPIIHRAEFLQMSVPCPDHKALLNKPEIRLFAIKSASPNGESRVTPPIPVPSISSHTQTRRNPLTPS